jgi:hypothetical protein
MKLTVYWTDTRGGYIGDVSFRTDVVDEDTGKIVGFVEARRSPRARHISLFGGKYHCDFEEPKECDAFAKGVESVLNHIVELPEAAASQAA